MGGINPTVLLDVANVETDRGRARKAQPGDLVLADIRAAVEVAALLKVSAKPGQL